MGGIAAFQVALVFGAPWGVYTQGGETEGALDTAGRVFAAVSCAILLVMAAGILARVPEGPLKHPPGKLVTALSLVHDDLFRAWRLSSTWQRRARRSAPCSHRPRSFCSCSS